MFRYEYQIDIKFDRQLRPATETSWVVSYGGKIIPRWRTVAILKIVISPYLSKNHPISMKFCTQQQILNRMNVTWLKMKKLHWTDCKFDRTYFLLYDDLYSPVHFSSPVIRHNVLSALEMLWLCAIQIYYLLTYLLTCLLTYLLTYIYGCDHDKSKLKNKRGFRHTHSAENNTASLLHRGQ